MQDGADAVEGPETENTITKRVNEHGYERRHLGGTDAESWINDRYHVSRFARRCPSKSLPTSLSDRGAQLILKSCTFFSFFPVIIPAQLQTHAHRALGTPRIIHHPST
jgi:hypothetical protein